MTVHLHPTAPLADRVLAPGDPGRALALAQALLDAPAMFNHNRGLWGYSGTARDGEPLTIQSTGMGGPSAAIVLSELAELGARRIVRVGTCGALDPELALGELVVVPEALARDGTSQALGAGERAPASATLLARLRGLASVRCAPVVSTDLFYEHRSGMVQEWAAAGAVAVEMECATLFSLAAQRGFEAAAVLIVSDRIRPHPARLDAEELKTAERRAGELALAGLSPGP